MTCPACSATLAAGHERCPACGAIVKPPVEGALAPDPAGVTPPARPRRDIPALRKKEPTWKDEVRDRVKHRRRQRTGEDELPLFRDAEDAGAGEGRADDAPLAEEVSGGDRADPYATTERMARPGLDEEDPAGDLPLRPSTEVGSHQDEVEDRDPAPRPRADPVVAEGPESLDEDADASAAEWPLELRPPAGESRPVERPARPSERVQAALLDLALFAALCVVVVYFASRAARVSVSGLLPSAAYLAGYLAFLGLAYAMYFTGTTGQTVGKMAFGLRVVDTAGRPPGHVRALLRAAAAIAGIAVIGGGLVPIFFDPARRALHDRLLRTRVVKG